VKSHDSDTRDPDPGYGLTDSSQLGAAFKINWVTVGIEVAGRVCALVDVLARLLSVRSRHDHSHDVRLDDAHPGLVIDFARNK
jgi:hypothetical protein